MTTARDKPPTGFPVVISAASGTGKTSLCRRLREIVPGIRTSISHTTRKRRGAEVDGREYHFVDDSTFDRMIADGEFLEWAIVFGNRYGTSLGALDEQLVLGHDVLLDIDVQGALNVRRARSDTVLIFLLPPSMDALRARLVGRGEDAADVIEARLAAARVEFVLAHEYDYILVNDDFDATATTLASIVRAHRARRDRAGALLAALMQAR